MNAVEIEEAVTELAEAEFDATEFPFAFLSAFGNKETTIRRLRTGNSNASDIERGVLQRNHIHLAVCDMGNVPTALSELRDSPANAKSKVKLILATDGVDLEAEDLISGETVACAYGDFADHFGFFLPLAGITTTREIRDNPVDIKATGRLNRLYVELLKENEDWGTDERRHDMNQFMARLIFCFFAEDTDIFLGEDLFTSTIEQMSDSQSDNTDHVIRELFRAMDLNREERNAADIPRWADALPYVNGGLFSGNHDIPKISRMARSYLLHAGKLNWKEINPDIFGSMIQAVADDEERGEIGMHYTSVPNILKVLNPLFLDSLREQLEEAVDNARKLLNLRKRLAKIRVFDPACGSGNFLVIAYKAMRAIEFEVNTRRGETHLKSEIPLTNFRGIEIRDFPAEIARLALIIAEYQCDEMYRGQKEALAEFLPIDTQNWIVCGNALRLDWLSVCPPAGRGVKHQADDLFYTPLDQAQIDFEKEGRETYICGNPPYKGTKGQSKSQKEDLLHVFEKFYGSFKVLDYVSGWVIKSAEFLTRASGGAALVSTNSICQGNQVPVLWPLIYKLGVEIDFAFSSFKWSNLASHNAGVTVIIVGLSVNSKEKALFISDGDELTTLRGKNINAYLALAPDVIVQKNQLPSGELDRMELGNQPYDGGNLIFEKDEFDQLHLSSSDQGMFRRSIIGSNEVIKGTERYCLWIEERNLDRAREISSVKAQIDKVREWRLKSTRPATRAMADRAHQFCEMKSGKTSVMIIPIRSSENREYLPFGLYDRSHIVSNLAYAIYDPKLLNISVLCSRLHLVWISAVCGRLETRFSYSNKMGWNTFPVPKLTVKNKADLTHCAEDILLAREAHFPAMIADLYEPEKIPDNLRAAHDRNDEVLERIYIGRRFKNDTERLEKLFELYTKMTEAAGKTGARKKKQIAETF